MPFNLGVGEVLVVLIVALLVFGGRLPEVGRSLGRSLTEFKQGLKGMGGELNRAVTPAPDEENEAGENPDEPEAVSNDAEVPSETQAGSDGDNGKA